MENNQKGFIEKLFREALQALASSPADQIRVTEPGYVPEEIADNYLTFSEYYINDFKEELDSEIIEEIQGLSSAVEAVPESAFCDTNEQSMQNPEWQIIRDYALRVLTLLKWSQDPPAPYEDLGGGIFQRR